MKNLNRIYHKFEDANEFTGSDRQKRYGRNAYRKLEAYCQASYGDRSDELLDLINGCRASAIDEAFLDGLRFGVKLLVECIL